MAYDEWLYRSSAPIIAASAAAGLTGKDADTANAYAMLVAKHKQLSHMPAEDGVKAYDKLDKKLQKALSQYFGDANPKYIPKKEEDTNIFGTVWNAATDVVGGAMDILTGYSEGLSNVYRSARTADSIGDFFSMDNWNDSWDGNKLFDPELEAEIERAYSPEVLKIARKYAMGKNAGEIMASMKGDKEWEAYIRFTKEDPEIMNAVRDYNDARISWGRDFARMFGLQPDIGARDQGAEGTIYKWVSGTADLAGDIAFDPLTYLAFPLSALNRARFGVTALINAERAAQGLEKIAELSKTQKLFAAAGQMKTWDTAFQVPSVRKAFDEAGSLLKTINSGASKGEINKARVELKTRYNFFDDITIDELTKANVVDADSALTFFKNSDAVENILQGTTGELTKLLPRYKATTYVKRNLTTAARNVFGYSRDAAKFDPIADTAIGILEKGESVANVAGVNSPLLDVKNLRNVRKNAGRMFERAFMDRSVFLGGEDTLGRSMKWSSAPTVYTLARSVLPKYHARQIAAAYGAAKDEATTRNILHGLLSTVADAMGLDRNGAHKEAFEKIMKSWGNPMYGEDVKIGKDVAHLFGGADRLNPAEINGTQMAVSANQLAQQTVIPNIKEFVDLLQKHTYLQGVSNTVNSRFVQGVTDAWSALNLLPRLGMRSVVDENIFHALTMPLTIIPEAIRGYRTSITQRMVSSDMKFWKPFGAKIGEKVDPVTGKVTAVRQKNAFQFAEREVGVAARVAYKFFVGASDDELRAALKNADAQRDMLQTQLTKHKFLGGLSDADAEFIGDLARFGGFDEVKEFSNGMNKAVSNGSIARTELNVPYENYNPNIAAMLKDLGEVFGGAPVSIRNVDTSFSVNFLFQLNTRIDRGGLANKIAVQYMDKPDKAVAEITDYLLNAGNYKGRGGDKFLSRFERSAHEAPSETAKRIYLNVRSVLQNDAGELNTKLLDKVRKFNPQTKKIEISAMDIGPDDLEDVKDMLPVELMGYKTQMPVFGDVGSFLTAVFDKGFKVSDRQVATLTREPAFYGYYLHYRRQLRAPQEAFLQKKIAEGMDPDVAMQVTKERYDFIGRELAMNRVIGFVDNPNVRSNFAYGMRNLSRYYRANEDFARRAMRAASPEAFIRLRMASEGLDEAGFIHEDENGDKYFFIPVDQITYNAYAPIVEYFTGSPPMQPMPMTLTGKIKMLSPSLDPESSLPTFSGPLMAVGWQFFKNVMPVEWRNQGERVMFGPYAENRELGDALMPSSLRKILEVANTTATSGISSQLQSAIMKSAAYYTANGMAPGPDATIREREEFRLQVQSTARNVVAIRNLLGIFSPVSPTLTTSRDVPEFLLDEGTTSFKTMFNDLVAAEYKKGSPDAYSKALSKWTKMFPGRLVYTVSETETDKVATIQKTKQAIDWMKRNQGIVNGFPQGSMFLAPQVPGFDMSAYAFLKAEGYVKYKPLEDYFEQIANIRAETEYRSMKKEAEGNIANAKLDYERSWLIDQWQTQKENFLKGKPYLRLKFEQSSGTQIKRDALDDLRALLDSGQADGMYGTKTLKKLVREFDSVDSMLNSVKSTTNAAMDWRARYKQQALERMNSIAGANPNAQLFYKEIIEGLIG